jgi:Putative bacterial sensory transduction regulator
MPDASREDIETFFEDTGWSYHRLEGEDWETRYSGTYTNQVITVRMTQYWVYFYATLINRVDEACRSKMFEHLALLNYKVSFGKFSIDKSNRICLGVEVPRENLQSSVFKDALNAISYLIDEHFRELLNIATDPDYVSRLKLEQESGGAVISPPAIIATTDSADEDVDWSDDEEEGKESGTSATATAADSAATDSDTVSALDNAAPASNSSDNPPPIAEASSDTEGHSEASAVEPPDSENGGSDANPIPLA